VGGESEGLCTQTPGCSSGIAVLLLPIYGLETLIQWRVLFKEIQSQEKTYGPPSVRPSENLTAKFPSPVPAPYVFLGFRVLVTAPYD